MKKIVIFLMSYTVLLSSHSYAEVQDCGVVTIKRVLTGPRHGAMMEVDKICGHNTWVCLDPDGEFMSAKESERVFSFVLASKMANKKVRLAVSKNKFANACGSSFSVVDDIRTP